MGRGMRNVWHIRCRAVRPVGFFGGIMSVRIGSRVSVSGLFAGLGVVVGGSRDRFSVLMDSGVTLSCPSRNVAVAV